MMAAFMGRFGLWKGRLATVGGIIALFGSSVFLLQTAEAGDAKNGSFAEEILTFPRAFTMGKLFLAHLTPDGTIASTERQFLAEARGDVHIPAGSFVRLKLSFDGVANAASLLKLDTRAFVFLDCRSLDNLDDNTLKVLGQFSNVRMISLDETDTTDGGLEALKSMKTLRHLALKRTLVTGKTFTVLKNFPKLRQLHLSFNQLKDSSFANFAPLKELDELDLSSCDIGDTAIAAVVTSTNLRSLDISKNQRITDSAVVSLKKLTKLEYLNVSDTGISNRSLESLKSLPLSKISFDLKKCPQEELVRLQTVFPKCKFVSAPQSSRPPDVFAPLK